MDELRDWLPGIAATLPDEMRPMAQAIVAETAEPIARLEQLGLGYLALDRASLTLSNGERQRVQLARAVRNRTTGALYVLDEPSIGLHPSNVEGLLGVMDDLLADGNTVVFVDHDVRVLRHAGHVIEIGPGSGESGGRVIAQGTVTQVEADPASRIGSFLAGRAKVRTRARADERTLFDQANREVVARDSKRMKASLTRGIVTACITLVIMSVVTVFIAGGNAWFGITPGTVIIMFTYTYTVTNQFNFINTGLQRINQAFGDASGMTAVLDEPRLVADAPDARPLVVEDRKSVV